MGFINWIAVIVILLASTGLLLSRDWRWSLSLLAVLHLGIFILVNRYWPLGMSAVKLITGWMGCAILGLTRWILRSGSTPESSWPQGRTFRLLSAGLVIVATAAVSPVISDRLAAITLPVAWGGILAIGMGLVHIGMTTQPSRVIVALLTILAGFELIYAAVEGSTLVAAMLAGVNLGLALLGAYLLNLPVPGEAKRS